MVEHHALDLAVGAAAPMAAGEEGPADLDFADLGLVAVIAARSDQTAGGTVDERKAHFGSDCTVEEFSKLRLGVSGGNRMHFPNLRIGAGRIELRPVIRSDRSDGDIGADQRRLKIWLRHGSKITDTPEKPKAEIN